MYKLLMTIMVMFMVNVNVIPTPKMEITNLHASQEEKIEASLTEVSQVNKETADLAEFQELNEMFEKTREGNEYSLTINLHYIGYNVDLDNHMASYQLYGNVTHEVYEITVYKYGRDKQDIIAVIRTPDGKIFNLASDEMVIYVNNIEK